MFDTVQRVLTEPARGAGDRRVVFHEHYLDGLPARLRPSGWPRPSASPRARWRIDPTAHPFCIVFDTRRPAHDPLRRDRAAPLVDADEAGHGLYAHGISKTSSAARERALTGWNESQSRTWENLVGRSKPFWAYWYDSLQDTFPDQLGNVGLDDLRRGDQPRRAPA